MYLFNDAALV